MHIQPPGNQRAVTAFLLAPLVPAALAALAEPATTSRLGDFLLIAIVGGYLPSLVFGLPLYLALRRRLAPRLPLVMGLGGLIAALPPLLVLMIGSEQQGTIGGHTLAIVDLAFGWSGLGPGTAFVATCFGLGLCGGFVFWLVLASSFGQMFTPDETTAAFPYA